MMIADVGVLMILYSFLDTWKVKSKPSNMSDLNKFCEQECYNMY